MAEESFKEKLKSINFASPSGGPKKSTDELGNTTIEHADGRVDVTVRPQSMKVLGAVNKEN